MTTDAEDVHGHVRLVGEMCLHLTSCSLQELSKRLATGASSQRINVSTPAFQRSGSPSTEVETFEIGVHIYVGALSPNIVEQGLASVWGRVSESRFNANCVYVNVPNTIMHRMRMLRLPLLKSRWCDRLHTKNRRGYGGFTSCTAAWPRPTVRGASIMQSVGMLPPMQAMPRPITVWPTVAHVFQISVGVFGRYPLTIYAYRTHAWRYGTQHTWAGCTVGGKG